ncbi:MAG: response regulator [Ignavibacteriales bacterium]|nr:response regulator [Ignavibacteriales bacterium]
MSELALIIEDDEDLASIFAEALRGVGFEVEHVADGKKARERLTVGTAPYLILLDMHLPHISGGELLANILKKDERFEKTMIIITTADARMGEAYRDQVDFVLVKPISFVQLQRPDQRLKPQR